MQQAQGLPPVTYAEVAHLALDAARVVAAWAADATALGDLV